MKSFINRRVHVRFAYPAGIIEPGQTKAELADGVIGVLAGYEDGFLKIETEIVHLRREIDGKTRTEAINLCCTLAHPQKYIGSIATLERA